VASFRSTRLEAVLGAAIDAALPYAALVALKTNQVTEATDLDYKREHYKNNDPKRALCGDIAAMANAAGGVILLGIAEDTRTSAAEDLVNVALGDDQTRRIRSIAASAIAPLPSFEVFPIADPADPGNGIIVIAVPQSPMRPHAVLVNDGFRFPIRNGTGTVYLTEAQVADAYRRRARRLDEGVAALPIPADERADFAEPRLRLMYTCDRWNRLPDLSSILVAGPLTAARRRRARRQLRRAVQRRSRRGRL
jgi:hypothetical protein